MNLEAFIDELIDTYREHGCLDIDGADMQDMLIKHGLWVERPATAQEAAEVAEDEYADYVFKEGEEIVADSPELIALRRRVREKAA